MSLKKILFCDLDIYYLRVKIMLILQNCLHVSNKNILQQYRVHSFLKKLRRAQLVYGYNFSLCFFPAKINDTFIFKY